MNTGCLKGRLHVEICQMEKMNYQNQKTKCIVQVCVYYVVSVPWRLYGNLWIVNVMHKLKKAIERQKNWIIIQITNRIWVSFCLNFSFINTPFQTFTTLTIRTNQIIAAPRLIYNLCDILYIYALYANTIGDYQAECMYVCIFS